MKWLREIEKETIGNNDYLKERKRLSQFYIQFTGRDSSTFNQVVNNILAYNSQDFDADAAVDRFNQQLDMISDGSEKDISSHANHALLALACVEALNREPTSETWHTIRKLKYHSHSLNWIFPSSCIITAQIDSNFGSKIIEVTSKLLTEYSKSGPQMYSERQLERFNQLKDRWIENPSLTQIWLGLRGGETLSRDGDNAAFKVLSTLDLHAFVQILEQFDEPFSVDGGLYTAWAPYSFDSWSSLILQAPIAFLDNGSWSGSFIGPLLLVIAHHQIMEFCNQIRIDTTDEELSRIQTEIDALIDDVVKHIKKRIDSTPLFIRWSTQLISNLLTNGSSGLSNESSKFHDNRNYVNHQLIEVMGQNINWQTTILCIWGNAVDSEYWCYRALIANHAKSDLCSYPEIESFINEWKLTPEQWKGEPGRQLNQRATEFLTRSRNSFSEYGIRLLAYPFTANPNTAEQWLKLWSLTYVLRDNVEFGNVGLLENESWQGQTRYEAENLLTFVFRLGLAIFDRLAEKFADILFVTEAEKLYIFLCDAVREMKFIDSTNSDNVNFWSMALRNLAVRRLLWTLDTSVAHKADRPKVFSNNTSPSFSMFVSYFKNDIFGLLFLIDLALANDAEKLELQQALTVASIDLRERLNFARKLMSIDNLRFPFNDTSLKRIETLI